MHIDLLSTSLRLLSADGRAAAAETFSDPHDLAALHDGLRQASTGAGEFGIELYNSVGVALRSSIRPKSVDLLASGPARISPFCDSQRVQSSSSSTARSCAGARSWTPPSRSKA